MTALTRRSCKRLNSIEKATLSRCGTLCSALGPLGPSPPIAISPLVAFFSPHSCVLTASVHHPACVCVLRALPLLAKGVHVAWRRCPCSATDMWGLPPRDAGGSRGDAAFSAVWRSRVAGLRNSTPGWVQRQVRTCVYIISEYMSCCV